MLTSASPAEPTYDRDWGIVSATSRSAYSLEKKVFGLTPAPLAPLSHRHFRYDLGRTELTRMVNALVAGYGMLDLGNLSWAYWHACAATAHIAPVQFGAAIEALQQAYIRSHPGEISTRILAPAQWDRLRSGIGCIIADADLSEDSKRALDDNLSVINLNKVPQRRVLKQILDDIGPSARQ